MKNVFFMLLGAAIIVLCDRVIPRFIKDLEARRALKDFIENGEDGKLYRQYCAKRECEG